MILVHMAVGMILGTIAAVYALVSGESLLMAIGAYSAVGTVGAVASAGLMVFLLALRDRHAWYSDQDDDEGRLTA